MDLLFVLSKITDLIRDAGGAFENPAVPGSVSLAILVCLAVTVAVFQMQVGRAVRASKWFVNLLKESSSEEEFASKLPTIEQKIKAGNSPQQKSLRVAWGEYKETLFLQFYDGQDAAGQERATYRNSVRPSVFFNAEELGFSKGFWRIVPGLFVTVGLFLTFLGLVGALSVLSSDLQSVSQQGGDPQAGLGRLLDLASAKFIMSLTGLACSIVFTVWLRLGQQRINAQVHEICLVLEDRLSFVSLEELASEQLRAARENVENFRKVGLEMVAELGRPLADTLKQELQPVLANIGAAGEQNVAGMVEELTKQISEGVGDALRSASNSLEGASGQFAQVATQLETSSGQINSNMQTSLEQLTSRMEELSETMRSSAADTTRVFSEGSSGLVSSMSDILVRIEQNTAQGATAIREAAEAMNAAAEAFRNKLEEAAASGAESVAENMNRVGDQAGQAVAEAGSSLVNSMADAARNIAEVAASMSADVAGNLVGPLNEVVSKLDQLGSSIVGSTQSFGQLSQSVTSGADAASRAAEDLGNSSSALAQAASPVREAVQRIEASTRNLEIATQSTSETFKAGAEANRSTLESLVAALAGEQAAIQAAIEQVKIAMQGLREQADRLDDMDEKLGTVFQQFQEQVQSALDTLDNHVGGLQSQVAPALDTMRAVVTQAEQFIPEQRRV